MLTMMGRGGLRGRAEPVLLTGDRGGACDTDRPYGL